MGSKYKCFQFNEDALFEKPIGPAFQSKIDYDLKSDNGSNAKDSNRVKIKVIKIKAVKKIDENSYSQEIYVWFNELTGVVYDYILDYPIGKIGKDIDGNFLKLENDVYLIDDVIDIPQTKLYDNL